MPVWREISDDEEEKLELSTEQLAYLNCSDYFRKKSGLDSFLKEWTGSFGYCSDCSGMDTPLLALQSLFHDKSHLIEYLSNSERNPVAQRFLAKNCPEPWMHKTDMFDKDTISLKRKVALYAPGFPCTPFSLLHVNSTLLNDSEARQFYETVRRVKSLAPCASILENVMGIFRVKDEVLAVLEQSLPEYEIRTIQLNPLRLGAPVSRERIYFLILRRELMQTNIDLDQFINKMLQEFESESPMSWQNLLLDRCHWVVRKTLVSNSYGAKKDLPKRLKLACKWPQRHREWARKENVKMRASRGSFKKAFPLAAQQVRCEREIQALEWLVDFNCPKITSHPVVVLFTDMLWTRVAMYYFLIGRLYFFITMSVFAFSQALLPSTDGAMSKEGNVAVFICRCFIYLGSMCHLLIRSIRLCYKDIRDRNFSRIWRIPVPEHLCCMTELGYIALFWTLLMMCIQEPIWWCLNDPSGDGLLFTSNCDGALYRADSYAALSCVAMLLYCALIINLSILSMRISSFVMMCGRVLAEVGLFLMAACFLIISFALGISALSHRSSAFQGLDNAAYSLFAIMIGLFPARDLDQMQDEIGVIITVSIFVIFIAIFLLNLLVAQLNQAYQIIFPDMQGYARLTRASVIVSAVEHASTQRWTRFLQGLHFDQRLEFEEGDVGLAGGIQVTEPSWAHPTTVDSIRRFGGSTSPEMPWPEDERLLTDDDRFERLEKLILRCTKGKKKRGEGTGDSSMRSGTGTSEGSYKSDSSNNSE